jgi:hypothetical protein
MARFNIKTLVNDTDEDFVDKYDGEEYVVPAHGELPLPDFIALHFVGDPNNPDDLKRAYDRRGRGGKHEIGITVHLKAEAEEETDKEMLVEGNKPIMAVKKTSSKKASKEETN